MIEKTTRCIFRCWLRQIALLLLAAVVAAAHGTDGEGFIGPADLALTPGRAAYRIVDLRPAAEHRAAHVPGALSLPLQEVSQQRLKALALAPDAPIVLYGESEAAGQKGKLLLEVLGYTNVRILAGGFTHWREDRQAVETGSARPAGDAAHEATAPGLAIEPKVHDFGVIRKEDGIVTASFRVQNTTAAAIVVTAIATSCGCTTAEIDTRSIPPGASRTLTVSFDPNFHKEPLGRFSRTVFLQTSTGEEIQAGITVKIAE